MTTVGWTALAVGLLLVPGVARSAQRRRVLVALGRVTREDLPTRDVRVSPTGLVVGVCATAVVGVVATGGVVLGLAAAVALATTVSVVRASLLARAARRSDADLLAAVRAMVTEVEAGGSSTAAFEAAAEVCTQRASLFASAAEQCRRGETPHLPGSELGGLGHAWRVAAETGAPIAAVLARAAEHLSWRLEQRRVVGAALAGPRSSAALLAGLPLLGLALGAAMQADPLAVLIGSGSGRMLCLVGVVLDAAGLLWTHRLTTHAERV